MIESFDCTNVQCTIEQNVSSEDVVLGEIVRVSKTQINVSLSGKMEHRVNLEAAETLQHIVGMGDVAMEEVEVCTVFEHSRIVSGAAVVQFIERYDVIRCWIFGHEMSNQPGCTTEVRSWLRHLY